MHALEQGPLNRLLRDLELTAPIAIRQAGAAADQYLWLLTRFRAMDAREPAEFQQRLARHVGLRGKLRARRDAFFDTVEAVKDLSAPSFADVLRSFSDLTGQVEKSAASTVLSLLEPDQPTIDRDLRELLPRYGFPVLAEAPAFDECVAWHGRLERLFEQVIAAPRWAAISARHDAGLPSAAGVVLTEARKLNLHLSHARRVVALMPTLEPVAAPRRPMTVGAAGESRLPHAAVRLHLCR
jgi:hypothetical protein